jgi:hypothetical protein
VIERVFYWIIGSNNRFKTTKINQKTIKFCQPLEDVLPEEIDDLLQNLHAYRDTLKEDVEYKVKAMNVITETLVKKVEF